jgi:predicted nucleic acid-binding protein
MITFDTGALIAVERRDRAMLAFLTAALAAGSRITVPAVVARILDALHIEALGGPLAKLAGETLATVPGATLVDAIVVASAARRGDLVLTSDAADLSRIRDAAFPSVRIRQLET